MGDPATPPARRTRILLAVLVVAFVATACLPYFVVQSVGVGVNGGDGVLQWSNAVDFDAGDGVAYYEIEIDGVLRATVWAPTTSCRLSGLASATTYTIEITATGTKDGEWSGTFGPPLTPLGRLTLAYTTPSGAKSETTPNCIDDALDVDGDRLADAVETDTGNFVSIANTGTDRLDPDSDNDGISDGDEVLGTLAGLNLPAMGVSPLRQDLLVELDWFDDDAEPLTCGAHSHRPTAASISGVDSMFDSAPIVNPDGSTGINLVADYGQSGPGNPGPFHGGNQVPDGDGVIAGGVFEPEFAAIKSAHFAPERWGYFHYVLLPHRYDTNSTSSGEAEVSGDDLIVSLACSYGVGSFARNTIAHELGHNLSLLHGGDEERNYKPNYNSVMNYAFQFFGVDTDCDRTPDDVLDYSGGSRATLYENDLDESVGICSGVPIDWNGNAVIEPSVTADINTDFFGNGDGLFSVLADHDDWANLDLDVLGSGSSSGEAFRRARLAISEQPVPELDG